MESQASWVEEEADKSDLGGSEHGKVEVMWQAVDAGGDGDARGGDGDGDASPGLSVNLERGLVLHGGAADGSSDEEEFDFDEVEDDGNVQVQWECPEEDFDPDGMRFGVELRTSPFKRAMSRQLTFQRSMPMAKKSLNYSGLQKEVESLSTSLSSGGRARMAPRPGSAAGYKDYDVPKASGMHDKAPTSHPKGPMPMEEDQLEQDLEGGEDDDTGGFDKVGAGEEELCKDQGRVSGLDSFTGSSGDRWAQLLWGW
nr:unnamed protein product [Digitaria exilis]